MRSRRASDRDDVVGDDGRLPVRACRVTFGSAQPLGLPLPGLQVERDEQVLRGREGMRVGIPGPGSDRAVLDDQQQPTGGHGARRGL